VVAAVKKARTRRRVWLARGLKTLRILLLLLVGMLLLVTLVLVFPATRARILGLGLDLATGNLPGEWTVAGAGWPELGRLEFDRVVWTNESGDGKVDTLVVLDRVELELDLGALRHRELGVRGLVLDLSLIDLPAIEKLGGEEMSSPADTVVGEPASMPYFREGSWPLLPAAFLDSLVIVVDRGRLTPELTVSELSLTAGLDLRPGGRPHAWLSDSGFLLVCPARGTTTMEVGIPGFSLHADPDNASAVLDSLSLAVPGLTMSDLADSTFATAWTAGGGAVLVVNGSFGNGDGGERRVDLQGKFRLPGPGRFAGMLPGDLPAEAMDPGRGSFNLAAELTGPDFNLDSASLRLDLAATPWLENGFLSGSLAGTSARVDTLSLSVWGVDVTARGEADTSRVDLSFLVELTDERILQILGGDGFRNARGSARLEGEIAGPLEAPDGSLDLSASLATDDFSLPRGTAAIRLAGDRMSAELGAGGEIHLGTFQLDSLKAGWEGSRQGRAIAGDPDYSQSFSLDIWLPDLTVALAGAAGGDTLRQVRLDSLELRTLDERASLADPVVFRYTPDGRLMQLEGFSLVGDAGHLNLEGKLSPEALDFKGAVDLDLKEGLLNSIFPSGIWSRDGGVDLTLKGDLNLAGTMEGPVFGGGVQAAVVSHRDNPSLVAAADFELAQGDTSGLKAGISLTAGTVSLLKGLVIWPGRADLRQGTWVPDPDRGLIVDFPEQVIPLRTVDSLLPTETGLRGDLGFFARMAPDSSGAERLQGRVHAEHLLVELPNSSRMDLVLDCRLEGTPIDPGVGGKITIKSGFIRIPEIPRNLLPVEGESLLWQAFADSGSAGLSFVDSLMILAEEQGPVVVPSGPGFLPDMELVIEIPGGLVVHGYGLNVDLEGKLEVTRGRDEDGVAVPVLDGYIRLKEGTLQFMNRVFTFTTAEIIFNGEVPTDPRLDINLEAEVSGYRVLIDVRGRGSSPEISLTSEPDLQQADIMSLLLFGQTMNDLDNDQRGRMQEENDPGQQLQQNLAALAMVFGTTGMQQSMSSALGVDMVEFGSDSEGDSTLMVGKYLTPKVLVKYHQSLEKSGTYFMTLDYSINRFFKLVSTYGQGEEDSGLELKWLRRY